MAEQRFVPKEGQVDYTHIRYAPVVNIVVTDGKKILLVRRSPQMRLYPGVWNGVSGFLDDARSIEEKVTEELQEELGISKEQIISIEKGRVLLQEAPKYGKTWLVIPVKATVTAPDISLDWEATEARWLTLKQAARLDLLPGFDDVLKALFV